MKNFLAGILLLTAITAFAPQPLQYVYIDDDPKETLYHQDKKCPELTKKGHGKIEKITIAEAIKLKRTPCAMCCKLEDKNNHVRPKRKP